MIDALSSIIEYRSLETGQHIHRIGLLTRTLLEDVAKNCPEYLFNEHTMALIASASSLHDIGKIAIPDAVLNKPGRLTEEEYTLMKTHAAKGAEMLTTLRRMGDQEYLRYAYNICRYHHERWDGRGYPDGLRGDAIPICAQVVGLADCYDALTNDRVYKKAIPSSQAINMILNGECGAFSPRLLESLKRVQGDFARLSAEYIDTAPDPSEIPAAQPEPVPEADALDTQQLVQMKYFTLLRQLDSTVMEVDFNTGLYHVVYLSGEGFEALRTGTTFEEAFRNFTAASVHPDDRAMVLEALDGYFDGLFHEGLMKRSRRYRVYFRSLRRYVWCQVTLLRVDTELPHQRRALILWRAERGEAGESRRPEQSEEIARRLLETVIGSVNRCRMDRWFTLEQPTPELAAFLGYTLRELEERFQNRYLELICPADRADVLRQVHRQRDHGDLLELEYRLTAKDGRTIWVLDKTLCVGSREGEQMLYFILIDITQSRQTQQELRLLSERYKLLVEQTNDIIFEWDAHKDVLTLSSNWNSRFGYAPIRENAVARLKSASHLHPSDALRVPEMLETLRRGKPPALDIRIADADGRYRWYRARIAPQYGDDGEPLRIIGVLSDIDREKRANQALRDEAERDSLTGLLNCKTAALRVEQIAAAREDGEQCAMLLLDLDGFKQVNDRCGHLCGDELLKNAAEGLRQAAGGSNLASRVGGDEFLLFLRSVPSREAALERAAQVSQSLQEVFARTVQDCQPTCFVGIALCPADGTTFNELFRRSDIALYRAKFAGKGCAMVYDAAMGDEFTPRSLPIAATTRIDSEE